jgi:hypothetical protein
MCGIQYWENWKVLFLFLILFYNSFHFLVESDLDISKGDVDSYRPVGSTFFDTTDWYELNDLNY